MTLYDIMKNNYGVTGNTAYQKQKKIYEGLGSPLGTYKGSAAQNIWLLNNQGQWDKVLNPQPAQPAQAAPAVTVTVKGPDPLLAAATDPFTKDVKNVPGFSTVVDKNKFMNPELVNQFATSFVQPENTRLKSDASSVLNNTLGANGIYNSGMAQRSQFDLANEYARMLNEGKQSYVDNANKSLQDLYLSLEKDYYTDPNSFQYTPPDYTKILNK